MISGFQNFLRTTKMAHRKEVIGDVPNVVKNFCWTFKSTEGCQGRGNISHNPPFDCFD